MMRNNLFINRLLILALNGKVAYNENFHRGINIVRGDNSSGKSTISNFIFFVLGGDFIDFVPEARRCREVYAETEMNGARITFRREVEIDENQKVKSKTPIYFFWGDLDQAMNPSTDMHWQKFSYNSYPEIKSFSNVIFDNLDIPIVKGESNITIHQLLRLMYVDQDSPTSSLFYYEQFDSQITRETTAELLLGIYNDELYQNKRRYLEVLKDIDDVKSEIKATKGFFSDPLLLSSDNIKIKIEKSQEQLHGIEHNIVELKFIGNTKKYKIDNFRFQQLSDEISKQRELVTKLKEVFNKLNYEVSDNEFFISSLNDRLKALKNSLITREFLNNFPLNYCPECLTEVVVKKDHDQTKCKLCKETIDSTLGITQGRRMEQEIGFQIIESTSIQKNLKEQIDVLAPNLKKEIAKLNDLQKRFDEELKYVKTSDEEMLESLYRQKGFIEGEILQFRTMLENAQYYESLLKKRDNLEKERDGIDAFIKKAKQSQNELKDRIEFQVKKEALYFLNHDLHRQDEFKSANDFHIDYSNNIAFLSSKYSKYSASSNFYLKVTARFALFLASLSVKEMRYPRFILADNMEDKGIEEKRAQNFQKILIERLKDFDQDNYQVIYTTSYITEELNKSAFVVGPYYTTANRTLKNI
jgi:chromosome segregation ATPase